MSDEKTNAEPSGASGGSVACPYVAGTVTRYCTLPNTSEKPNSSTLTDAEREAVERVSVAYDLLPTEGARQIAATLRALLERL